MLKRSNLAFQAFKVILDALLLSCCWFAAYGLRHYSGPLPIPEIGAPGTGQYLEVLPIVVVSFCVSAYFWDLYENGRQLYTLRNMERILATAVFGWLLSVAGLYYYRSTPFSRWMLGMFLAFSPFALFMSRLIVRRFASVCYARGIDTEKVAIIGAGRLARKVIRQLQGNRDGVEVSYIISHQDACTKDSILGVPCHGSVSRLPDLVRQKPVDTVLVALPGEKASELQRVLSALGKVPVEIAFLPDLTGVLQVGLEVFDVEGMPMVSLYQRPVSGWAAVAKRSFDLVGACALVLICSIPMAIIAALIKLTSRGPVFYRQTRMSLGGDPFTMLKFRSMQADAESETGPARAREDDPRVTTVGRILRRTGLDELPQLFNVIVGDMSLVGPRPERPYFVQQLCDRLPAYMQRHHVKGGITGWAQVNDLRQGAPFDKRWEYDLYYINNWSLSFDLFILLATPFALLFHKNAY